MNRCPSTGSKSTPGRGGHPLLRQQPRAEVGGIIGEVGDVGVHVEGAVGGRQPVDSQSAQPAEQQAAVGGIPGDVAVAFVIGVERGQRGVLGRGRRADGQVPGERVQSVGQVGGHQQPADPPARHREVLAERVDHEPGAVGGPAAGGVPGVGDAVIDLVGDQPDPGFGTVPREPGQFSGVEHGARRVGGAGHHQAVEPQSVDHGGGRLVAGLRAAREVDNLAPQGVQDVSIRRVARAGQPHPAADVEGGQEGQQEPARGTGGHHDVRRIDQQAVGAVVVPGDGPAQWRDARRLGVAEQLGVQGAVGGGPDRPGCGRGRLAGGQVEHRLAAFGPPGGGGQHPHDVERRHRGPLRRAQPRGVVRRRDEGWHGGIQAVPGTSTRPSAAAAAMSVRCCDPRREIPSTNS